MKIVSNIITAMCIYYGYICYILAKMSEAALIVWDLSYWSIPYVQMVLLIIK